MKPGTTSPDGQNPAQPTDGGQKKKIGVKVPGPNVSNCSDSESIIAAAINITLFGSEYWYTWPACNAADNFC
eukprot:jgi/Psemu1/60590/gm1.60590_g